MNTEQGGGSFKLPPFISVLPAARPSWTPSFMTLRPCHGVTVAVLVGIVVAGFSSK